MKNELKSREFLLMMGGPILFPSLVCEPSFSSVSVKSVQTLKNTGTDLVTGVEKFYGIPTFTLNGKPYMIPVMETYERNGTYFADFAKAGTQIFSMNTNTGEDMYNRGVAIRPAKDKWDFSGLDHWVENALKTRPDAMFMPMVYVSTPKWWLDENPSEIELFENSTPYSRPAAAGTRQGRLYPSLASEKWRNEMAFNLKKLLEYINNSEYGNRVFGYLLAGLNTEEWWHFGGPDYAYSNLYLEGYKKWLGKKYKSNESLRSAWQKKDISFETVKLPGLSERIVNRTLRKVPDEMHVIDFWAYHNEIIPETIDFFAGIVNEMTNRKNVVGALYPYTFWDRDPWIGHNAVKQYLASPNLDFAFVTAGYSDRRPGGCDYARAPVLSVQMHNQVFYFDSDYASHLQTLKQQLQQLNKPGLDDEAKFQILDRPTTEESRGKTTAEDINLFLRIAGFNLCSGTFQSFFVIYNGAYASEQIMKAVETINKMYERSVAYDRSSNAEILFVADEVSCSYCGSSSNYEGGRSRLLERTLLRTQFTIPKIGAPVDQIFLHDIGLVDMNRYKLVVFTNCFNTTKEQRQIINDRVKGGKRIIMWSYVPGYFETNSSSDKLMSDLIGIQLRVSNDESLVSSMIEIRKNEHPLSQMFDKAGVIAVEEAGQSYCKMISVTDKDSVPIGFHPETTDIKLAVKDMKTWISLYSFTANCTSGFFRELARYAGVHIYHELDDTFYINNSYMCIHANGRGRKVISFPDYMSVINALDENILFKRAKKIFCDLQHGETKIFRLEKIT